MKKFVLDAWAVLALLQKEEPAAARVKKLFEDAQTQRLALFISVINLGEVFYRVGKVKGESQAQKTLAEIRRLPLTEVSVTDEQVWAAATLKIRYLISYADAFAAVTAQSLDAALVTGDPELISLRQEFQIEKLSRNK